MTVKDAETVTYRGHRIIVRERALDILDPEGRLLIRNVRWTLSTARSYIRAYIRRSPSERVSASAASTSADCHAASPATGAA